MEGRKGKLGANAMKHVAAGAHLPTPWFFEPAKRPDDHQEATIGTSACRRRIGHLEIEFVRPLSDTVAHCSQLDIRDKEHATEPELLRRQIIPFSKTDSPSLNDYESIPSFIKFQPTLYLL